MADIRFDCPNCKQSLEAPPEMAGQSIGCPTCATTLAIPNPVRVVVAPPVVAPVAAPAAPPVAPPAAAQPLARGLTHCPACGAVASKKADRCPQCGHPIYRGLFGRAGAERYVNCGCVVVILLVMAMGGCGVCLGLGRR